MRTVKEVSRLTGVSVRALHHYDAIGLLKPAEVTEAGYRLYDDAAIGRLQSILLFRELRFPLKQIKAILDSPDFDPLDAISDQIRLLELEHKRIGEIIGFAREIQTKGVTTMSFDAFDKREIEKYREEVTEKWGGTKAYQEFEQKDAARDSGFYDRLAGEMMAIFAELGGMRHLSPDDEQVKQKIAELQKFITDNYYTCTKEILGGLGQMYVGDGRFKENIDKAGGAGTAEFVSKSINLYCSR